MLNCSLKIPPTAGSGSGINNNPVGYDRLYVNVNSTPDQNSNDNTESQTLTWDGWWNALRAGRVTITNGPLIRPNVEGQLPGYVFKVDEGQSIELPIGLTLSTREKIRYLEVIKNGRSEIEANLDEFQASGGKLPPIKFSASGWFLVRAITDNSKTYRYATTAPYFVDVGYHPRISRASVQFFLDWTNKRAEEIAAAAKSDDSTAAQTAVKYAQQAQAYWKSLLEHSTAD